MVKKKQNLKMVKHVFKLKSLNLTSQENFKEKDSSLRTYKTSYTTAHSNNILNIYVYLRRGVYDTFDISSDKARWTLSRSLSNGAKNKMELHSYVFVLVNKGISTDMIIWNNWYINFFIVTIVNHPCFSQLSMAYWKMLISSLAKTLLSDIIFNYELLR